MPYGFSSFKRVVLAGCLLLLSFLNSSFAQIVPVGSGSYTNTFPGTDIAGRNSFPSGVPLTTGNAAGKPVPTNDWWSNKVKNNHSDNLFSYPFTLKTINTGLVVSYIPWGVIDSYLPVVVGVTGLNSNVCKVSDFSDWTVSLNWKGTTQNFTATAGIGMPFLYFTKDSADVASITVNEGTASIDNEKLIILNARNGADFVVYAPTGSSWNQSGKTYTSTLNGKNYWSLAFIPLTATNVTAVANEYKKYAYVFPKNTLANWHYTEASALVQTEFIVETDIKEGSDTTVLLGLLPHQWAHLAANSPAPNGYTYANVRGQIKTIASNRFTVENKFYGILPTLPYVDNLSNGFSAMQLKEKVDAIKNDGLSTWTDSYNEGQVMNRLIQTARIAALTKDTAALNTMLKTVKERLENWLTAKPGEVAFLFYYNQNWSTLIGYPGGHGQDGNINDHHFHWGYFIHAAAFLEQYEPGWKDKWGSMINLLVKDAANNSRTSNDYPHLRNFSPYAGHCWANGFATFPQGNDQESTSESMQFNSALIHWGEVTGNKAIRDLGIYLYTTEQTAIEEYWLDIYNRNFASNQLYSLVSRVWGNSYDNGTFWTADIAASYGIEMYPIHGGSLYLGHDTNYVKTLWAEIEKNTGILTNQVNDNLWHDVYWSYLSFINPQKAINLYNSFPHRNLKFGISDAQTYHWLHAMNVLGNVSNSITSNHPLAAVFIKNGVKTYVAQNYGNTPLQVTFSDNFSFTVPAKSFKTNKDINANGTLSTAFTEVYPGGSLTLALNLTEGTATKVQFMEGDVVIGEDTQAPYSLVVKNLEVGKKNFYARIYEGTNFGISNMLSILVGEKLPFLGEPTSIPGTLMAGNYDSFEGGLGQGITYNDNNAKNEGDFRNNEYVDASVNATEGNVIGWIASGEWLSYTIDVKQAGIYSLQFRYACGNNAGGGPFILSSDGLQIAAPISVSSSGNWNTWTSKTIANITLKSGVQTLKIYFENGELNLGKLTFTYLSPLPYSQPIAEAGNNQLVQLPNNTAVLNGSNSIDPANGTLTYAWKQIYGPNLLTLNNATLAQPQVSGMQEGVYLMELGVSNGSYSDKDQVYLISSLSNNIAPKVSITKPTEGSRYFANEPINLQAIASDLNGTISEVKLYEGPRLVGSQANAPYAYNWYGLPGAYSFIAKAIDNNGAMQNSKVLNLFIDSTPSCRGRAFNGDFEYLFSEDENNPTLTFIPSKAGVGSPTCILYYGLNAGSLPGYTVSANVPFRLNAAKGSQIYFYYTYSFPGAGERNTAANKNTYKIGSCKPFVSPTGLGQENNASTLKYYPNPVIDKLWLELSNGLNQIKVYAISGKLLDTQLTQEQVYSYDMSAFAAGMYLFEITHAKGTRSIKVYKE
jgi:endoglucanase Acf2